MEKFLLGQLKKSTEKSFFSSCMLFLLDNTYEYNIVSVFNSDWSALGFFQAMYKGGAKKFLVQPISQNLTNH